eukprot:TRINITY_DN276_c0_g1_i2.p1 TRINITY_DN276_c0_g1~~TRINITY_DN276_c0_g1_i2.p1  ORF type:complete len:100 (+),score=26.28 TRINITY_DN276_c0_g1_i2:104-403(+)
MAQRVGGTTPVQQPTDEVIALANQLQGEIKAQAGIEFDVFEVLGFQSQVVAGTNFFLDIKVNDNQRVHARVFRPLPHTGAGPEVVRTKLVDNNEELSYF